MTTVPKKKGFLNFFPTPEYLLLSTSGLAITDDSIKLLQFEHNFFTQNLKLSYYDKVSLPQGIVESGFINDAEKLTTVLKELSKGYGFKYVYATLPEERAYLFSATIDRVPSEGLRDAVAFIIEENVPVSLADSVFDFDVVEELKETNQIKVTVSVLAKKVVDFYIQVFEAAGVTPVSFDIESQAIARAIVPEGDKRTQLIVNLTDAKTGFYIVEDEVVQFTTTLPYGTKSPLSFENLKNEMAKIFAYWSSRNAGSGLPPRQIEKILLCGLGAYNQDFVADLMREVTIESASANLWANVGRPINDLPERVTKESLDYTSTVGLVIPHRHPVYV